MKLLIKRMTLSRMIHTAILLILLVHFASAGCDVSHCDDCDDDDDDICIDCDDGYTLIGGFCCREYCSVCTKSSTCTACVNNSYTIEGNRCKPCSDFIQNCIQCSTKTSCITCIAPYMNAGDSCYTCSSAMTGCTTCTSPTICTACANNSIAVSPSTNKCVACSSLLDGCSTCTSPTTCASCTNSTYIFNASTNVCDTCSSLMDQCVTCSSSNTCTACINTSYAISNSSCVVCEAILVGCLQCNSSTVCIDCVNDTLAVNPSVYQCSPCNTFLSFCTNCDSTTVCKNCEVSPNIVLSNQTCVYCGAVIPNCLNCTSTTICTLCSQYYIVNAASTCSLCSTSMFGCMDCDSNIVCTRCSLGSVVVGGCSSTPGCIAVNQKGTCISCNSTSFIAQPINGTCVCKKGHLAGQYCTEIIGCVNAIENREGTVICVVCNMAKKFILQNGTCNCPSYYYLSSESCVQICGDGKLFYLPCDDGNNANGDGCSSTCQVEPRYDCDGTASLQSNCIYKGIVKLQYVCTYKKENNVAEVVLTINPFISNILKSNLVVDYTPQKNSTLGSASFVGSNIVLLIDYQQDIEGSAANITIQYDTNYIQSANSTVVISLNQCNGDRLYYEAETSKSLKGLISAFIQVLNIAVLLVWFIGSYSHKMIGVQTLHTIQFIFISQISATRYLPVIVYFDKMSSILNIFQAEVTNATPLASQAESRINYSADFLHNNGVVTCLQVIVAMVFLVVWICRSNRPQGMKQIRRQRQNSQIILDYTAKIRRFLYDFLVFPAFIGFFLNFMLSLMVHSNKKLTKEFTYSFIQTLAILFCGICGSLIYFSEWKPFIFKKKGDTKQLTHKDNYVPFYLTYFFLLCLFVEGSVAALIPNPTEILLAIAFINTLVIVIYRPYHSWFHNLALFINNLALVANLSWVLSQQYIYLPKAKDELIAAVVIAWMGLILILAIIRILIELRSKNQGLREKKEEKMKNRRAKPQQFEMQMMKAIEEQTAEKINSYLVNSQLIRFKKIQDEQTRQRRREQIYQLQHRLRRTMNNQQLRNPFNNQN